MPTLAALLVLAAVTPQKPSISLAAPVDPVVAAKTHDQLAANLTPSAKNKLQSAVTSVRTSAAITDGSSRAAVAAAFPGANLSDSDMQAMMFLVMMEASNASQQDLTAIAAEVAKINDQKSSLRSKLAALGKAQTTPPRIAKVVVQTNPVDFYKAPDPLPENATPADMEKRIQDLEAMGSANQKRVQALTNQQVQMQSLINNTFKAAQSVPANIIRNLK